MRTVLHTANLKAALAFACFERTRYAFDGIHVSPNATVVATDGKALFRAVGHEVDPESTKCGTNGFPGDGGPECLLPIDQVATIVKTATDPHVVLTNGMHSYQIRLATNLSDQTTAEGEPIEGGFPKFELLFDRHAEAEAVKGTVTVCFSVANLEKLLKAAKAYGRDSLIDLSARIVDKDGKPEDPRMVATYFRIHDGSDQTGQAEAGRLADGFLMPVSR